MALLWLILGGLIGAYAAQKKGFSVVGGLVVAAQMAASVAAAAADEVLLRYALIGDGMDPNAVTDDGGDNGT